MEVYYISDVGKLFDLEERESNPSPPSSVILLVVGYFSCFLIGIVVADIKGSNSQQHSGENKNGETEGADDVLTIQSKRTLGC